MEWKLTFTCSHHFIHEKLWFLNGALWYTQCYFRTPLQWKCGFFLLWFKAIHSSLPKAYALHLDNKMEWAFNRQHDSCQKGHTSHIGWGQKTLQVNWCIQKESKGTQFFVIYLEFDHIFPQTGWGWGYLILAYFLGVEASWKGDWRAGPVSPWWRSSPWWPSSQLQGDTCPSDYAPMHHIALQHIGMGF